MFKQIEKQQQAIFFSTAVLNKGPPPGEQKLKQIAASSVLIFFALKHGCVSIQPSSQAEMGGRLMILERFVALQVGLQELVVDVLVFISCGDKCMDALFFRGRLIFC